MDRQIFERFNASKKPVDADGHISCGRMDHARGHHRGLLGNHCEYIRRAQAERSELVLVHLDVNILFLHTKKLDLLHVFHGRQTAADFFSVFSFFFIGEIVSCDSINRAVHIIETVVDERPHDAGRKASPFIFDEVPHLMPACLYVFLGHIVLEVDIDDRLAVMRERP